jgi:hypothetical protein
MFKLYFSDFENFRATADYYGVPNTLLDEFFYNRLWREYANAEVAQDNPHNFYGEFFNTWEDSIFEVSKKKELAETIIIMGNEDYSKDYNISTFAQNPNEAPTAPKTLLNYFNTQNYTESNMKKVEAYSRALQLIPRYIVKDFTKRFRNLFLSCITEQTTIY